jgi:hypothetical protein
VVLWSVVLHVGRELGEDVDSCNVGLMVLRCKTRIPAERRRK